MYSYEVGEYNNVITRMQSWYHIAMALLLSFCYTHVKLLVNV